MKAVVRLNLIVSMIFAVALAVTVYAMLQQASKDINREVLSSLSFTHQLLNSAAHDETLLAELLTVGVRHVRIDRLSPEEYISKGPGSGLPIARDTDLPRWFFGLIPGVEHLEDKQYYRYLSSGDLLRLQANTADEVEEVWESVQAIVLLFLLSCLLSTCAIYLGVRSGLKPVAHFLEALEHIRDGHFTTRLSSYKIKEINQLSCHFNVMAKELERAERNNQRLTQQLMQVQEQERAHLARELHDDIGQYLTGIQAQTFLIRKSSNDPERVSRVAEQITMNCEAMQQGFRQLIRDLHPVILEQLGLQDALQNLITNWKQQYPLSVRINIAEPLPDLGDETSTHIYRIVQEALNNIAKHAEASTVNVDLQVKPLLLQLRISDNGRGLQGHSQGLGLRSMRERAICMGGKLYFEAVNPKGTAVVLLLPLSEEVSDENSAGG